MHEPKRVVIIGCGGIGSWLAPGLARALEFQAPYSQLVLVDGDSFELKNAERQNFVQYGNKAHALRNDLQQFVNNTFLVPMAAWVVAPEFETEESDPEEEGVIKVAPHNLLQENDIVYVVVDNFAARKLIFDAATAYENIDILTGGNDERLFGTVYHYQRRNGADVTNHIANVHDEYLNPPDRNVGEMSCAERAAVDGGTQTLAANMAVASWLLGKSCYLLFGTEDEKEKMLQNTEVYFDMEAGAARSSDRRIHVDELIEV